MTHHPIVTAEAWTEARKQLLKEEKAFDRQRDQLSQRRRELPWVRVEKHYTFDGPDGSLSLTQLFGEQSQLIVYHFMFAPDWQDGCRGCSFWADNFNGILPHLAARDVAFAAISRAPVAKLQAFAKRLSWNFPWFSSQGNSFNYDYGVSFTPEALTDGTAVYNYAAMALDMSDMPGISVFFKDEDGQIYHTYSCYARGLDMMNTAYHYLDLAPKGRDEAGLSHPMAWLRHRDLYGQ